jgi:hypothetical protein
VGGAASTACDTEVPAQLAADDVSDLALSVTPARHDHFWHCLLFFHETGAEDSLLKFYFIYENNRKLEKKLDNAIKSCLRIWNPSIFLTYG